MFKWVIEEIFYLVCDCECNIGKITKYALVSIICDLWICAGITTLNVMDLKLEIIGKQEH